MPNIFASTDEGAMRGLGYASARDRGFQMHYVTRIMQGRLAETIGDVKKRSRDETAVDNDRKMRLFGFYRGAQKIAANLDADTRSLLDAYCSGVNEYFAASRDNLHPMFAKYEFTPELWTPADCLVSWWHVGQFFAADGTRKLLSWRNYMEDPDAPHLKADKLFDDAASAVKERDVSSQWIEQVNAFGREHGLIEGNGLGDKGGKKFSHAWVVGGDKSSTGSATLCSDPQTPATNPSLWYEFHVSGKTFNVRGIGVPGSPLVLIGWNENLAWGMTALGADQADEFRLKTDAQHPDQYFFDGQWKKMDVRTETIKVKGGKDVRMTIRETHFGPVATELSFPRKGDPEVALKRVPMCDTNTDTLQGSLAMMRSKNVFEFWKALDGWNFPTVNCLYGDKNGDIGYSIAGSIPLRSRHAIDHGKYAHDGTESKYDWQGYLPHDLAPHNFNPSEGYILSGNHRPVGSFYKLPIGAGTGSGGDTGRSWRLRELLSAKESFTPKDVLDIHYDSVSPPRRDIVRVAMYLRDTGYKLSPAAADSLKVLEPWFKRGGSMDVNDPGSAIASKMPVSVRAMDDGDVAATYGGGESGLAYFLKSTVKKIESGEKFELSDAEAQFINDAVASAWNQGKGRDGGDRGARAPDPRMPNLGYFEGLDGFPSLDEKGDITAPNLTVLDGGCIGCQRAQSYTHFIPLHDVDSAMSILPIDNGDRFDVETRLCTYKLWEEKKLHPAPLSRKAVEKYVKERVTLGVSLN
ncbi:MAG: penicillin acylase family protein [Planctomycetaceae bacterium]|nr:penicillin acylase family protein [Planctomycetaceae bacterium]